MNVQLNDFLDFKNNKKKYHNFDSFCRFSKEVIFVAFVLFNFLLEAFNHIPERWFSNCSLTLGSTQNCLGGISLVDYPLNLTKGKNSKMLGI